MGLPGWPGGDPDAIKSAAKAWDALHEALLDVVEQSDPVMQTMFSQWEGQAATRFETTWQKFATVHQNAATGAAAVGKALDTFADKLEEAHKKYEHMVEAMAATAVVGIGLAIFTGGLSAAAGAAAETAVAGEIATLLVELGASLAEAVELATATAEAVGGAVEAAVGLAVDFSIGFAMSAGDQAMESELDGEGFQVKWDQAALSGLTSAALGPLMRGKSLPLRITIGAGGMGASGALAQLDDLFLHGGLKEGETFNLKTLLVDLAAGAALGGVAKGSAGEIDSGMANIEKMLDDMADNPTIAEMIKTDPDWIKVYSTDPDIMSIISAETKAGATFAVSSGGVATVMHDVQEVVVDVKAPKALAEYTKEELVPRLTEKGIDVTKESVKKAMEQTIEENGGEAKVAQMSPDQLRELAREAVAHIPGPRAVAGAH